MTKISRPFQIALVAVVLLAAVYFVALRKHSSGESESSAPAPAASSATTPSAPSSSSSSSAGTSASSGSATSPSAGATSTYKGSAPGVDGLTRAIQKARGAVSESEQHAKALQQKATAASGSPEKLGSSATGTPAGAAASGGTAAAKHSATTQSASSAASAVNAKSKTPASKANDAKSASGIPVMQARVEGELEHGKVAALLFWNPSGAVDNTVRRELQATARKLHGRLAINIARSSEVGSFGTFTRTVQVYGTPTILLINPAGKTASVTGLTDVFSLEQAVREVKHSK